MLQVDFGIHRGLSWAVEEVGDTKKRISVYLGDLVEHLKVSAETERAVFILSEEDWSAVRRE